MENETSTTSEAAAGDAPDDASSTGLIVEELLVEEISIDGMCGVY